MVNDLDQEGILMNKYDGQSNSDSHYTDAVVAVAGAAQTNISCPMISRCAVRHRYSFKHDGRPLSDAHRASAVVVDAANSHLIPKRSVQRRHSFQHDGQGPLETHGIDAVVADAARHSMIPISTVAASALFPRRLES